MEKAKLDWQTFTARRRLDVSAWLKSKQIKNHGELKIWCESKDMTPPTKDEAKAFFAAPKKPKNAEPAAKEEPVVIKSEDEPAKVRKGRPKKKVDVED